MKKIIVLIFLLTIIATPSYALNLLERLLYKEVRIDGGKVLVNKATDKVEKRLVGTQYEEVSSEKGWGGIPSERDMYQARYDRIK